MKKIIITIASIILLLIVAMLVAPIFIPTGQFLTIAKSSVKEKTGRDIEIGSVSISLFPSAHVKLGEVTLLNPEGHKSPYAARISEVSVGIKLIPLLSRTIEVSSIVIKDPHIIFETINDRNNWAFTQIKKEPGGINAPKTDSAKSIEQLSVDSIEIKNARIESYKMGKGEVLLSSLDISIKKLEEITGSLKLNDKTIKIKGKTNISKLLAQEKVPADIEISSDFFKVVFDGNATNEKIFKLDGNINATIHAINEAITLLSGKPSNLPFKTATMVGSLNANSQPHIKTIANLIIDQEIKSNIDFSTNIKESTGDIVMKDANIGELLKKFTKTDKLSGNGDIEYSFRIPPGAPGSVLSSLQGKGSISLYNVNIKPGEVPQAILDILKIDSSALTDYSKITASFVQNSGVISNNDLVMEGKAIKATGTGFINLLEHSIKYRLIPKIGERSVPILIEGDLKNPLIRPDPNALIEEGIKVLKDPKKLKEELGKAKKALKSKEGREQLKEQLFKGIIKQ